MKTKRDKTLIYISTYGLNLLGVTSASITELIMAMAKVFAPNNARVFVWFRIGTSFARRIGRSIKWAK